MSPTAGHIIVFGDTVTNDLFRSETCRVTGKQIAVIWIQMVSFSVEYLSYRQLYPVMPCIGSMIRPADSLFQIIRCPVIKEPARYQETEPLCQRFLIGCLY